MLKKHVLICTGVLALGATILCVPILMDWWSKRQIVNRLLGDRGEWDEWFEANRGNALDLSGVNLNGADLRGVWLSDVNLRGAMLEGSDLSGSDLENSDLMGSNLSGAKAVEAGFSDADLSGASLRNANLRGSGFNSANLIGADLRGADFSDAILSHANLQHANLRGAIFHGSELNEVNLSGADVSGVNFSGASLAESNLSGADVSGVDFANVFLVDSNIEDLRGWRRIERFTGAYIRGNDNPPPGFIRLSKEGGAFEYDIESWLIYLRLNKEDTIEYHNLDSKERSGYLREKEDVMDDGEYKYDASYFEGEDLMDCFGEW